MGKLGNLAPHKWVSHKARKEGRKEGVSEWVSEWVSTHKNVIKLQQSWSMGHNWTSTRQWRMNGKWSGNNFLLSFSSLGNHGNYLRLLSFFSKNLPSYTNNPQGFTYQGWVITHKQVGNIGRKVVSKNSPYLCVNHLLT